MLIFSSTPFNRACGVPLEDALFLIAPGIISFETNYYWRREALADPYGIEWALNYSITENIIVTSLSSSIVKFEKQFTIYVHNAYQKIKSITYYPTHYGIIFYDQEYNELDAINSTTLMNKPPFYFSVTRNVEKLTGKRISAQKPYGITIVELFAFYNETLLYRSNSIEPRTVDKSGSYTNVYYLNSTKWNIGDVIDENYIVSGESKFQNFPTWVLEHNKIPEGYTTHTNKTEYEKTSGLIVKESFQGSQTDSFYFEETRQLVDITEIIDDGYPRVSAPPGKVVDSPNPVVILFQGSDSHFSHFNLYQNGSIYETNDVLKTEWSFSLTPTLGNTTWTFEIVDTLGYSSNATTWLMYQVLKPIDTTTEEKTTSNETSPTISSGFTIFFGFISLGMISLLRRRSTHV
jgi:uncharacterized protein (UPF0333 family)